MTETSEALADVRRAYRLVWAYQRRIMDLVQVIGDNFDGQEFYAWSPVGTQRPAQLTTNPFKRWAWDVLPFYKMSVLFLPVGSDPNNLKRGDWMLEVNINTDDVSFADFKGEPDAAKFQDAESSLSLLTLICWQCTKNTKTNWYWQVWNKGQWPERNLEILDQTEWPVRCLSLQSRMEVLNDKASIISLVDAFKATLTEKLDIAFDRK